MPLLNNVTGKYQPTSAAAPKRTWPVDSERLFIARRPVSKYFVHISATNLAPTTHRWNQRVARAW